MRTCVRARAMTVLLHVGASARLAASGDSAPPGLRPVVVLPSVPPADRSLLVSVGPLRRRADRTRSRRMPRRQGHHEHPGAKERLSDPAAAWQLQTRLQLLHRLPCASQRRERKVTDASRLTAAWRDPGRSPVLAAPAAADTLCAHAHIPDARCLL